MSSAKPRGESWISANYEKLALLVVMALLLVSVVLLFFLLNSKKAVINAASWERSPSNPAAAAGINTDLVSAISSALANPVQVPLERRRMAVGPLRVACVASNEPIGYDASTCPFCKAAQPNPGDEDKRDSDGDQLTDKWETKYALNPMDPSDAMADIDNDGFSNLDEFFGETDPKDALSKPDPRSKLRRGPTTAVSFKLRFLAISKLPSGNRYQLNLKDLSRTYFVTNGQTVEGVTVAGCDEKDPRKPVLILQQGAKTLRLPLNEVIIEDSYSCQVVSLIDKKPFRIEKGHTFKLGDTDYNVVDITRDAVVIRDAKNGRESTVPLLTEDERAKLRGGDSGAPEMRRPGTGRESESPSASPFDFPLR